MNNLIEKIVERLQERAEEVRDIAFNAEKNGHSNTADKYYKAQRSYLQSIDIIHEEAKAYNEEVCEWQYSSLDEDLIRPYHHKKSVGMYKECLKSHPYCSCCGKKIKVIG